MQEGYSNLLCLSASAGSGKTFKLVGRYLSLLFMGANASEILALTFTKKAATEMQERVTDALREIALVPNLATSKSDQLKELLNSGLTLQKVEETRQRIYEDFLQSDVKIMTIDSFFGYILRRFCWYVGVSNTFESVGAEDKDRVLELFLSTLSKEQKFELAHFVAQESLDGFLNILEGLCAIKNELKEEFFHREVEKFAQNKALTIALELRELLIGQNILEKGGISALDFRDIKGLLSKGKTWISKEHLNDFRFFRKVEVSAEMEKLFLALKHSLLEVFWLQEGQYLVAINQFFKSYMFAKDLWAKENNALSFQEITLRVYDLLVGQKLESASLQDFLYFRLDSRISHILIDEFQDTNLIQYEVLKPLIAEICAGIGRKGNRSFFYVGDPKQSIYRFRGGRQELFDAVAKEFSMKVQPLQFNFRSSTNVVEFVNNVFSQHFMHYVNQFPKKTQSGFVRVLDSTNPCKSATELVKNLLKCGAREEDIAILSLKNDRLEEMSNYLKEDNISVVLETSAQIFNHFSVKALMKALYYYDNTNNLLAKEEFFCLTQKHLEDMLLPANLSSRIVTLMQKYELASASAQKFLELSLNYETLEDLESKIPLLDCKMPSEDLLGVRLLSIHKSKGLEFPYVIVLDTKTRNISNRLIYSYDELKLQKIYFNTTPKENKDLRKQLDSPFNEALSKDELLEQQEEFNCFYVALTRARIGLFVVQLEKEGSGELDGDFKVLGLSNESLGEIDSSNILPTTTSTEKQDKIQEYERLPEYCLTSENFGRQKEKISLHKEGDFNQLAIAWGNATHYALELGIKGILQREDIFNLLQNRFGLFLNKDSLELLLSRVERALEYKEFKDLLSKGEVHCETSFIWEDRENRIDMLILGKMENYIIDYKSGLPREEYKEQVKFYVENVTRITQKPSYGYIFYLGDSLDLQRVV